MEAACRDLTPSENEPYMSERQIAYFRRQLLQWRELVERETSSCRQELTREQDENGDIIDRSVVLMAQRMALLNGQRTQNLLMRIDAALQRIDSGKFGYCLRSGEAIGLRRLLAWPVATLSVEAQEELERMSRQRN